jgi:DNA-binding transcriptional ArsR family regulator
LRLVWKSELQAGEIADHFSVSRPAISQHLTVLKNAGLIAERRDGTRRLYKACPEVMAQLKAFLDEFWRDHLESLKYEAELEERRRTERAAERK